MPGVIATIPKLRFTNGSGAPLAGGTLTVYAAGTTTLANTWQDRALTIANTNPVSLDGNGACVVWLDSALFYKIVVKDSLGAVQWTQDNIAGGGVDDSVELAAPAIQAASDAAVASRTAIDNRIYPGAYAGDPSTRPDGSASQAGDEYFNSTGSLRKRFNGAIWVASDINTANLAASSGSSLVGHIASGTGAVATTLQAKARERVTPQDFMTAAQVADVAARTRSLDVSAAIVAAFASGAKHIEFQPGDYRITMTESTPLVSLVSQSDIQITGFGAKLYDPHTYTVDSVTAVFNLNACSNVKCIGLDYEGVPLANPSLASFGIGYRGATFMNLGNGCENIEVEARLVDLRYGVRSGDYTTPALGYNKRIKTRLKTLRCGYPIAHYLAEDVEADLYGESNHRCAYLAGVKGFRVHAKFKDQYIAPSQVLMTDAMTGTGTSRGCSAGRVFARDMGSTTYTPNGYCVAISPSRVDPGTTYQDIEVEVHMVGTDTSAATLGAFTAYSNVLAIDPSYPFNWEQTITLKRIKVKAVIDRSAQTVAEHGTGEVYFYTLDSGTHYATVQDVEFDVQYTPGSGSKPRGFWFFMPGLVGSAKFTGNYGTATQFLYATNATSLGLFTNATLQGTYSGTSDSPYLSAASFVNCSIASQAFQPTTNKTFTNTLVQGAGSVVKRLMTELTLTGASVTWANALPGSSIILGVSGYTTEAITGATGYLAGISTATGKYYNTNTLTVGNPFTAANGTDTSPPIQAVGGSIVITAKTANFTGGKLRLCVDYIQLNAPTS